MFVHERWYNDDFFFEQIKDFLVYIWKVDDAPTPRLYSFLLVFYQSL